MGNYCDFGTTDPEPALLPPLTLNRNYILESWQMMKLHNQLGFMSGGEENEILSYLLSLPRRRNQLKIVPVRPDENMFVAYKYEAFFYLGQMGKDSIEGNGAIVLPGKKIFVGEFKNNRIEGKGQLIFLISEASDAKKVKIAGKWSDEIKGNLSIETYDQSVPFATTKTAIKQQKSLKYIIYPNYDEYLGETENQQAHGMGKYIYRNGQQSSQYPCYQGMFRAGLREGRGVLRYNEDEELSINWKNGRPDGVGYMQIRKTRITVVYKNGQRINQLPSEVL